MKIIIVIGVGILIFLGIRLLRLGLKPGPVFRQLLETTLEAKLNGKVQTRQDELLFARQWIETRTSHNLLDSRQLSQ